MALIEKPVPSDLTDMDFWADKPDASMEDYAQAKMNPELLLGFMSLLWPDLLVHDGRVFIARTFSSETLDKWLDTQTFKEGGMSAVQAVMNHVHVDDFFYRAGHQVSDDNLKFVARVMAAAWKARLQDEFPDRSFVVDVQEDEIWISEP